MARTGCANSWKVYKHFCCQGVIAPPLNRMNQPTRLIRSPSKSPSRGITSSGFQPQFSSTRKHASRKLREDQWYFTLSLTTFMRRSTKLILSLHEEQNGLHCPATSNMTVLSSIRTRRSVCHPLTRT